MKILLSLIFIANLLLAFQSHNPYVKYISLDNHKIGILNYAFQINYDCIEKKPDMVVEELYKWMMFKKHYKREHISFRPDYNILSVCGSKKSMSFPNDLTRTGQDRGHNAANYNWAWNRKYQLQTFKMSNITPQSPTLNRYLWKYIEGFSRYLSVKEEHIYVYTGSFGKKGYVKNKVVIPEYWYKLILVPQTHEAYLFLVKNEKYPKKKYTYNEIQKYLTDLATFNKLNKDFNLKLKGNWKFKQIIVKKKTNLKDRIFNLLKNF